MKHEIIIKQTGYGHWKVSTMYYGKLISTTTTDSIAIDDYNSDPYEKEGRRLRKLSGYNALREEIIRDNK